MIEQGGGVMHSAELEVMECIGTQEGDSTMGETDLGTARNAAGAIAQYFIRKRAVRQ